MQNACYIPYTVQGCAKFVSFAVNSFNTTVEILDIYDDLHYTLYISLETLHNCQNCGKKVHNIVSLSESLSDRLGVGQDTAVVYENVPSYIQVSWDKTAALTR